MPSTRFTGVLPSPRWLFIALLMSVLAFGYALPSQATEFVEAHKGYLGIATGYRENGTEVAQAYADKFCSTSGGSAVNCVGVYTGESWDVASNSWRWNGTLTYASSFSGSSSTIVIAGPITYGCPQLGSWSPYQLSTNPGRCSRAEPPVVPCHTCNAKTAPKVGNPITVNGGVKQQVEVDYRNASGTLQFVRTYRSDEGRWLHNYQIAGIDPAKVNYKASPDYACYSAIDSATGKPWCFGYGGNGSPNSFSLRRGPGRLINFGTTTDYAPAKDIDDRATPILDEAGQRTGWRVTNGVNDTVELFALSGYLLSSTARNGQVTTFTYSDAATPVAIAPKPGLLLKVQDAFGQALQFTYDSQGRMAGMTDPAGQAYLYAYDTLDNLASVTYPDGKTRTYVYNELANTSNVAQTNLLTGIIDENTSRYATFAYFSDRRGKSTEHAGAVEKYALTYPDGSTTSVTDPLVANYRYVYTNTVGVLRLSSTTRPAASGTGTVSTSTGYDANANVASYRDFDGSLTAYTYDLARNLETKRVEASGTTIARTISTEWHATLRIPTRIAEPLRRTTYTHDAAGNVLTRTVQATTDATGSQGFNATLAGTARTWTYTYSPLGQLLTVKGPRTDVNDTTTYTYSEQGNLATIANALNHVTTLSNYDAHGRVGRATDANGLITDFVYTPRGWLSSTTTGSATTSYVYDNAGQLTGVTLPGSVTLTYSYDAAHRLTGVADNAGNSIVYTLDAIGNRTTEQVKDNGGTLMRQIARVYDPLNRLKQITGAQQ